MKRLLFGTLFATLCSCSNQQIKPVEVQQWTTHELLLSSHTTFQNGYTDVEVWAWFVNDSGDSLMRPAFWDGGQTWKIRFAPPDSVSMWSWRSYASVEDAGLAGRTGAVQSMPYSGENRLLRHGLLKMSSGKRNVIHADGKPFLVVGDTPWSIPYRATTEQVHVYATDRKVKGFNTALLITLQPDRYADGPEARNTVLGFDRAFEDLGDGRLEKLKPDYFQTLDSIISILISNELVPVYAPFAHGYGWKGETAIGPQVIPEEYERYCRYLVARYGSAPAMWLINLDSHPARVPGVIPGGRIIEQSDAYQQPTGLHYSPYDDWIAGWANGDSTCCFHYNKVYQDEPWLDFQWAQTGHDGLHLYHKVERMYDNKPVKANLNGESTYEAMGEGKLGLGWWQGEDAWMQLMHGGTMGVVYGAASLWQWKITSDEPGWPEWTNAPLSWRDAMELEGARYVALISKAFEGYDFADMEKRWDLTADGSPLLSKEGKFYIAFLIDGGQVKINNMVEGLPYHWFNPRTGEFTASEKTTSEGIFHSPDLRPWVLIVGEKKYR